MWGEQTQESSITLIDGSVLQVTTSLARSLPQIAKACETGYLWIDQLTIDQTNFSERNAQVRIMGEIYRRSSMCLVWLGTDPRYGDFLAESDWDHKVGEAVKDFFNSFPDENPSLDSEPRRLPPAPLELRRTSSPEFLRDGSARRPSLASDYLLWFFDHEWFRRTWGQ